MTTRMTFILGVLGCLLMGLAGLGKVLAGEAVLGLLLSGFSCSMYVNLQLFHKYGHLFVSSSAGSHQRNSRNEQEDIHLE